MTLNKSNIHISTNEIEIISCIYQNTFQISLPVFPEHDICRIFGPLDLLLPCKLVAVLGVLLGPPNPTFSYPFPSDSVAICQHCKCQAFFYVVRRAGRRPFPLGLRSKRGGNSPWHSCELPDCFLPQHNPLHQPKRHLFSHRCNSWTIYNHQFPDKNTEIRCAKTPTHLRR